MGGGADDVAGSYDRVADEYVRRIYDELRHKPFDRQRLDAFAARLRDRGPVCDLGCGPGHVARYLHERGVTVCGIDLSPVMIERARQLNPGIAFTQGDMRTLAVPDGAWAGITAFYSLIHILRSELVPTLRELRRALRAGGVLLLAFHLGDEVLHLDEWMGHAVDVDFVFFRTEEMLSALGSAGFAVEEAIERDPYPDVEHQSRRAYITARAP